MPYIDFKIRKKIPAVKEVLENKTVKKQIDWLSIFMIFVIIIILLIILYFWIILKINVAAQSLYTSAQNSNSQNEANSWGQ